MPSPGVAILFIAALLLACAPTGVDCGEPTKLEAHPERPSFLGAPLGPLLVRNFRDEETTAIVSEYTPGYATKVVIVVARPFEKTLTLRGRRCSDGVPLRFASSYPFAFNSTPAPSAVFAAAGEEAVMIRPMTTVPSGIVLGADALPYMLFASSGKWLLELHESQTVIGRAVACPAGAVIVNGQLEVRGFGQVKVRTHSHWDRPLSPRIRAS